MYSHTYLHLYLYTYIQRNMLHISYLCFNLHNYIFYCAVIYFDHKRVSNKILTS